MLLNGVLWVLIIALVIGLTWLLLAAKGREQEQTNRANAAESELAARRSARSEASLPARIYSEVDSGDPHRAGRMALEASASRLLALQDVMHDMAHEMARDNKDWDSFTEQVSRMVRASAEAAQACLLYTQYASACGFCDGFSPPKRNPDETVRALLDRFGAGPASTHQLGIVQEIMLRARDASEASLAFLSTGSGSEQLDPSRRELELLANSLRRAVVTMDDLAWESLVLLRTIRAMDPVS